MFATRIGIELVLCTVVLGSFPRKFHVRLVFLSEFNSYFVVLFDISTCWTLSLVVCLVKITFVLEVPHFFELIWKLG